MISVPGLEVQERYLTAVPRSIDPANSPTICVGESVCRPMPWIREVVSHCGGSSTKRGRELNRGYALNWTGRKMHEVDVCKSASAR